MRFSVKAPATSANLGPGFDTIGIALDIWNSATIDTDVSDVEIIEIINLPGPSSRREVPMETSDSAEEGEDLPAIPQEAGAAPREADDTEETGSEDEGPIFLARRHGGKGKGKVMRGHHKHGRHHDLSGFHGLGGPMRGGGGHREGWKCVE